MAVLFGPPRFPVKALMAPGLRARGFGPPIHGGRAPSG